MTTLGVAIQRAPQHRRATEFPRKIGWASVRIFFTREVENFEEHNEVVGSATSGVAQTRWRRTQCRRARSASPCARRSRDCPHRNRRRSMPGPRPWSSTVLSVEERWARKPCSEDEHTCRAIRIGAARALFDRALDGQNHPNHLILLTIRQGRGSNPRWAFTSL